MRYTQSVILTISIFLLLIGQAMPVPTEREDFKVNSDNGNYEQTDSRIAVAPDGSFVIIWIDKREGENNVYLQRYDDTGFPSGANVKINDDPVPAWQAQPALDAGISGQYGMVWQDYRTDGYPSNPDIMFQPLDSISIPIGININITPGYQNWMRENADIALSAWGAGVVVWADYLNGNWDIYGQLIGTDGSLIGSSFKVNDDAGSYQQHYPKVATSAEGWFVVTWYDNRSGNDDIYIQRFNSDATPIGVNIKVNTDGTSNRQTFPDITTDGAGNFTVVWVDYRNGSYPDNPDIFAAKYEKDMTPLTGNFKLNTDGTERAQKYAAISADRMGNVGLVWADSTSLAWKIVGQMIDVEGVVREVDFYADFSGDSTKIKPQIALSGTHRYVTWVDRRDGNYDIYASITKYNDPKLVVSPLSLTFEMEQLGGVPEEQYVVVEDIGYNRLGYKVFSYNSWISCNPTSGLTPDSFAVTITSDDLPFGTYTGAIMVIDTVNHDSTGIIAVRLDVESAILEVFPDTIDVVAIYSLDTVINRSISLSNIGVGEIIGTASSNASWIDIPISSVAVPGDVIIDINSSSLPAGAHEAAVVIEAVNAQNSPDTVIVILTIRDDIPILSVTPDSILTTSNLPAEIDTFITIQNNGGGVTNWTALSADSWLLIDRTTGTGNDIIRLSIDESQITPGLWDSYVEITDSNAINISTVCFFQLEYIEDFVDTIRIEPINLSHSEEGVSIINLDLISTVESIFLPFQFDTTGVIVDSLIFGTGLPLYMEKYSHINNSLSQFTLEVSSIAPGMYMTEGEYLLAEIFFTSQNNNITTFFDTLSNDSVYPLIITSTGTAKTPVTISGEIVIEDFVDTIRIESANLLLGEEGVSEISLDLSSTIESIFLPFQFDTNAVIVDSLIFGSELPLYMNKYSQINNSFSQFTLELSSITPDVYMTEGEYLLAEIFFTAQDNIISTIFDTLYNDSLYPFLITSTGATKNPITISGEIVIEGFVDTVRILPTNLLSGEEGVSVISFDLSSTIESIFLPFQYDTNAVIVDSLIFGAGLPLYMDKYSQINNSFSQFTLELSSSTPGMYMTEGEYLLGEIFFTSQGNGMITSFDTLNNDSLYPFIITSTEATTTPIIISGDIVIGEPTPADDYIPGFLPEKVELHNNYPNPFNSGTNIQFELPIKSYIRLEIYNILGQQIKTLINKQYSAGLHTVSWDGTTYDNWSAPSGIYFYRLSGIDFSIVKKMVLLQ